jgi:uncharacterized membrane protein YfcA
MSDVPIYLLLCVSAFAAGVVNAVAGGGTLLTFPALLTALAERPPGLRDVSANTTSTVALVPGTMAGAWGYKGDLGGMRPWLALLLPPSLLGGLVGSLLLIEFPNAFLLVVPWLLLLAATLFMAQPTLNRYLQRGAAPDSKKDNGSASDAPPASWTGRLALLGFQFLVGVYGGYFGAGIGILMLSGLALIGLTDIHRMNAVKTILASAMNLVSVVVFVVHPKGGIAWIYGPVMAVASIAGGYAGARLSRRLPQPLVRWLVIVIGYGLAAYYFLKQAGSPT